MKFDETLKVEPVLINGLPTEYKIYNQKNNLLGIAPAKLNGCADCNCGGCIEEPEDLQFIYTNYKGETTQRTVKPISIRYGNTQWHPLNTWLLLAFDYEKDAEREFAINDILSFKVN